MYLHNLNRIISLSDATSRWQFSASFFSSFVSFHFLSSVNKKILTKFGKTWKWCDFKTRKLWKVFDVNSTLFLRCSKVCWNQSLDGSVINLKILFFFGQTWQLCENNKLEMCHYKQFFYFTINKNSHTIRLPISVQPIFSKIWKCSKSFEVFLIELRDIFHKLSPLQSC